jgi:transcriptional regulator with XRE-family HTH domain
VAKTVFSKEYRAVIGALVRARRGQMVTQVELATRLGEVQSYVSKIERCERRVDVIEFVAIGKALGIDPYRLLKKVLG